jgi:hypothetical protein
MRLFFASLALAGTLFLSAPAFADAPNVVDLSQEPQGQSTEVFEVRDAQKFSINFKASNARVNIKVNDVPVLFRIFRSQEDFTYSFNEWLKRGLNVIELSAEKFDQENMSTLTYNVFYQSPSQLVTGEKLVLFQSPAEVSLPIRQLVGIRAQTIPFLRVWKTEEVDPSPDEQRRLLEAINGFRARLVDALGKADNAFLATYNKPIRDEINRAYGRPVEGESEIMKQRMDLANRMKELVNAELITTPNLRLEELALEIIGNKRMIKVSRLDGRPLIEISRGDMHYVIDKPIFGSVGGVWEMLRE